MFRGSGFCMLMFVLSLISSLPKKAGIAMTTPFSGPMASSVAFIMAGPKHPVWSYSAKLEHFYIVEIINHAFSLSSDPLFSMELLALSLINSSTIIAPKTLTSYTQRRQ